MGIAIPDEVLIENSRLHNKREILTKMNAAAQSPEAQEQAALMKAAQTAEIEKTQAETRAKDADTQLKTAKAGKEQITAEKDAMTPIEDNGNEAAVIKAQTDMQLAREKHDGEMEMAREKHALDMQLKQTADARADKESAARITNERVAAITGDNDADNQPKKPTKEKA
jgi:hypothetical protein